MNIAIALQGVYTELDGLSMSAKARRGLEARLEILTRQVEILSADHRGLTASEARLSSALNALNVAVGAVPGAEENPSVKVARDFARLAVEQSGVALRAPVIQITRTAPAEEPKDAEAPAPSAEQPQLGLENT